MTLVLIGPMGSGKTKLGKRIAVLLGKPFIDTDRVVVAGHGPIASIFEEFGEAHFRSLERVAVQDALAQDAVVALGGGAILNEDTQADLTEHRVALIMVSERAVESRISGTKRPLLTDGLATWVSILESRRGIYDRLARRTWDTSSRPLTLIASEIADWVMSAEPMEAAPMPADPMQADPMQAERTHSGQTLSEPIHE